MADEPRAMTQEEIDALFANLSGSMPAIPKVDKPGSEPPQEPPADPPPVAGGAEDGDNKNQKPDDNAGGASLGQDDIDALLADMGADDGAASEPAAAAAPSDSGAALGQDDIDALLADMGADDSGSASEPAAAPADSGATLGQDDIDALLADMGADDAASAPEPAAAADGGAALGQDDIDALLAEMDGGDPEPSAEPAAADGGAALGQDDIDALLAEMDGGGDSTPDVGDPSSVTMVADDDDESDALTGTQSSASEGPLSQNDIDSLLAELSGVENAPVTDSELADAKPVAEKPREAGKVKTDLSQEEIDSLVTKHDGDGREDTEALISQNDIDALVRQMGEATDEPSAQDFTEAMQKRGSDIEALLDQAANDLTAADAVADISAFEAPNAGRSAPGIPVPVGGMAPEELRGTRFLLVAAVFLLAMCAVTMVFVVGSINKLSSELQANRETTVQPTDDYAENLRIATDMMNDEDEDEAAKGIRFMEGLRRNHPSHDLEISLLLARYQLERKKYKKSVVEFEYVLQRQQGLIEDPTFYLDFAKARLAMDDLDQARKVVMTLLANERYFLETPDPNEVLGEETLLRNQ